MTRRSNIAVLAAAFAASATLKGKDNDLMKELLEASMKDKKGVMVYMKGQNIGGVVTKVEGDWVELRNREYGRILVRMESIDGLAMA